MCISTYESLHEERKAIIADIAYLHSQCNKYQGASDTFVDDHRHNAGSNMFSVEANRLGAIRDAIESRIFGV
jgi:hypothetical protein